MVKFFLRKDDEVILFHVLSWSHLVNITWTEEGNEVYAKNKVLSEEGARCYWKERIEEGYIRDFDLDKENNE